MRYLCQPHVLKRSSLNALRMKAGIQQRKTTAANRRKIEQNVISKFLIRLQPHTVFAKNMSFKMKIQF